jgi:hypothetical protein
VINSKKKPAGCEPAGLVETRAEGEGKMTTADQYRLNAANCAQMAEMAENEPDRNRFKRMEAAWRALAEEQDWLDGEKSSTKPPST